MYLSSSHTNLPLSQDEHVSLHLQLSLMMKMNGRLKRFLIQNCAIANCGIRSTEWAIPYQRTLGNLHWTWKTHQISSNNFISIIHLNLCKLFVNHFSKKKFSFHVSIYFIYIITYLIFHL